MSFIIGTYGVKSIGLILIDLNIIFRKLRGNNNAIHKTKHWASRTKERIEAYLILLISSTLYAGNVIAGKLIANDVPSAGLSAVRGILGLMIIVPLTWSRLKISTRPNRKEMLQLLVLGFFGITLAYLTFIVGMKYSSGTNASIIAATLPALTNSLLVIGFKTKLNKLQFWGIATSFLGLLIVFTKGSIHHLLTLNLGLGDIILLANVLFMAFFYVLSQRIMKKLSSIVTSVYALAFGTFLLIPMGVWQLVSAPWHINFYKLLIIIYMGCFVTGFAFFLTSKALISSAADVLQFLVTFSQCFQ